MFNIYTLSSWEKLHVNFLFVVSKKKKNFFVRKCDRHLMCLKNGMLKSNENVHKKITTPAFQKACQFANLLLFACNLRIQLRKNSS